MQKATLLLLFFALLLIGCSKEKEHKEPEAKEANKSIQAVTQSSSGPQTKAKEPAEQKCVFSTNLGNTVTITKEKKIKGLPLSHEKMLLLFTVPKCKVCEDFVAQIRQSLDHAATQTVTLSQGTRKECFGKLFAYRQGEAIAPTTLLVQGEEILAIYYGIIPIETLQHQLHKGKR